jgi:hypothetical protein
LFLQQQSRQRAQATLIGLSSLRREGDVTVNSMAQHTTIRSRFLLGPLTLRVEKQVCHPLGAPPLSHCFHIHHYV